ncbi:MAG TPA: bile acid:sodium symporter family protein [Salinivirgaceae bacterium]|nr:bile acid:sodium symporter family protein [Salinivirgaceae bacterium]
MREALEVLDPIRLNFEQGGVFLLNLILAFIMYGVALNIELSHFKNIGKNPKSVVVGFLSQFVILPFLTFLLTLAVSRWITVGVALGMILVAACPGGNISNFISALARGNIALSVSLTAISSLTSIILTPFNFSLYGNAYLYFLTLKSNLSRPIEIDSVQMFQTVFIILGIPLLLGMLTNSRFPEFTKKINKTIRILSLVFFAGFVIIAFRNNYEYFVRYIHYIFLIVLLHNALGLLGGYYFSKIMGQTSINSRTIAIETGIQNSGLALALIFNPKIFPIELEIGGMAFIAAWWGIWHIISGVAIAYWWRRQTPND